MTATLEDLRDKHSLITYAEAAGYRTSGSAEENASFIVRWASELFGEWATWLNFILPNSRVS